MMSRTPGKAMPNPVRKRKVRTPQSSVPDNVRAFQAAGSGGRFRVCRTFMAWDDGKCHREHTADRRTARCGEVRVKRCGKSAPPAQSCAGHGKPHTEQDQIGRDFRKEARAGSARHNLRVGRWSRAAMSGQEE